jgi:hypothetical protein
MCMDTFRLASFSRIAALIFVFSISANASEKTSKKKKNQAPVTVSVRERVREARDLYASGNYSQATMRYESIPVSAPEYLRTREELAWTYLRDQSWNKLRGILPHLNSQLVPLRWRLEGRVLSSMLYLRDCKYDAVKSEIEDFVTEMTPLARQIDKKLHRSANAGYWQDLQAEVQESISKMKFVRMELRSRLMMIDHNLMANSKSSSFSSASLKVASGSGEQVYPVDREFWSDELFHARGESPSACASLHKAKVIQ